MTELAECARRRGWRRAVVTGNKEFRVGVSRALLRRCIAVVDCQLSDEEHHRLLASSGVPGLSLTGMATALLPELLQPA